MISSNFEKQCLTLVLTITASGNMLPPLIIFESNKEIQIESDYLYFAHSDNGWMTSEIMIKYFEDVILDNVGSNSGLFIFDSFRGISYSLKMMSFQFS